MAGGTKCYEVTGRYQNQVGATPAKNCPPLMPKPLAVFGQPQSTVTPVRSLRAG